MVNLTGRRMKALKMQNLSQMNIKNFEEQKVGCRVPPPPHTHTPVSREMLTCVCGWTVQAIMEAIREAIAEDESGAGGP